MGIPAYFSYIVKNHAHILKRYSKYPIQVNHFYLDSNSIIYDVFYKSEGPVSDWLDFATRICQQIDSYILTIRPTDSVFIAFDGVAPFAKIQQQRSRRYKSWFMAQMAHKQYSESELTTTMFTPGTPFMKFFAGFLKKWKWNSTTCPHQNIRVSTSETPGEGEHKIFQLIRDHPEIHANKNVVVYGLDADLLMLSIFHSERTNLFVFRETPEFIKSIQADLIPNETYYIDIQRLCLSILQEMNCGYSNFARVYDYAFFCFLLGNDFLPHFPTIHLRNHGIQTLLDIYRHTFGNTDKYLIHPINSTIQWNHVFLLLKAIQPMERQYFIEEMERRDRMRINTSVNTKEEREYVFNATPLIYRQDEFFIAPNEEGWQSRYYSVLFHFDTSSVKSRTDRTDIVVNYLEGLEWTYLYYTGGTPDWSWHYRYHYPPLFETMVECSNQRFHWKWNRKSKPISSVDQLSYVLHRDDFIKCVDSETADKYLTEYKERFVDMPKFQWAFCRYFWEAHLV
jgi:5'-3' exonuclease